MLYEKLWLTCIKDDILRKYQIKNPIFFLNELELSDSEIFDWVKELTFDQIGGTWPQYKRLQKNHFGLGCYEANPNLETCKRLIEDFFDNLSFVPESALFTVSGITPLGNHIIGTNFYTLSEVKGELLYFFRYGKSLILEYAPPTVRKDNTTYHLWVIEDSLMNSLKNGYLQLEYNSILPTSLVT